MVGLLDGMSERIIDGRPLFDKRAGRIKVPAHPVDMGGNFVFFGIQAVATLQAPAFLNDS
jgi:hypothetical protein